MTKECSDSLLGSLPVDKMEGPYPARLPSSSIGEKSRRAPVGRRTAEQRELPPSQNRTPAVLGSLPRSATDTCVGRRSSFADRPAWEPTERYD